MPGKYQYDIELKSNVAKLLTDMKEVQDRLDTVEGKEYKIKLNVDEKKLSNVISNLEKMLDSLGKGTGDFKQFENLSKELSSIVSEVQNLSKAFGKVDDSGTKTLLSSIQNIDKSLSELSQHIINVNKNMSNIGGDTNSTVKQVENISNAYDNASKSAEKLVEAQSKIGNKSNISSGTQIKDVFQSGKIDQVTTSAKELDNTLEQVNIPTDSFDEVLSKLDLTKSELSEIVKITKQSVSDSEGKFHDSYTLKDKRGSTEIYGLSSNTEKGQLLRSNIVGYDAKAAEQETKAVKEVWDKNVKAIQDYMDAVTKLNNLNAKDKGTGKYSSQIALQEKNVEELKGKALEARTAITSMINPHNVPLNTWRDYLDVMKKFDQASLGSAESVAKLEDALRKMDFSSLESAGTKFESQFNNLSIKPDGDHQFLSWTNDLKELNAKIDEYNSKVKYLKENNIVDGEQVDEVKNLRNEIEETINVMSKTSQAKRGWTDIGASKAAEKVANVLKQNTKMSKEARDAIRAYYNELRSGNPSQPIDEILVKVNQLVQKERELGRVGKSFGEIFKEKVIYGGAAQLAGMVGFYDLINIGREGFQTIRELDTALTEMKKVSDETTQSLKNYQSTTFDVGDAVGATAKTIQNSTADWMRLGESIDEAAESAKVSNILLNVSEFESIDEATESLVAMSQAYSELGKMDIIDVLNNIGNNYSIATDGLATALQKSASALKTANNDLNSAVALATAGNAVVQDPDSVGAGIRTISLRLVGTEAAKQELESIGEETDDVITTTSKLRDTILSATAAASKDGKGFDIFDSNGNYKSTYEIMQGLADLYDDIVAKDKELGTNNLNLLLETIAGKNRSNIAASILQNGEMLRSVYQDAQNSSGSAQKELDSYLDSIDGRHFAMLYRNM